MCQVLWFYCLSLDVSVKYISKIFYGVNVFWRPWKWLDIVDPQVVDSVICIILLEISPWVSLNKMNHIWVFDFIDAPHWRLITLNNMQ